MVLKAFFVDIEWLWPDFWFCGQVLKSFFHRLYMPDFGLIHLQSKNFATWRKFRYLAKFMPTFPMDILLFSENFANQQKFRYLAKVSPCKWSKSKTKTAREEGNVIHNHQHLVIFYNIQWLWLCFLAIRCYSTKVCFIYMAKFSLNSKIFAS